MSNDTAKIASLVVIALMLYLLFFRSPSVSHNKNNQSLNIQVTLFGDNTANQGDGNAFDKTVEPSK